MLKIVFMGSPAFATSHLRALLASQSYKIVGVLTQPPRRAKRGKFFQKTPIHHIAEEAEIPVRTPSGIFCDHTTQWLTKLQADIFVVVAYGLILPQSVLNLPRWGCINIHASLLPRWRGAAPIVHALLDGDQETGITLIKMDAGMDTGPILLKKSCTIKPDDTAQILQDRLQALGSQCLLAGLDTIAKKQDILISQPQEGISYAKKTSKADAKIRWNANAEVVERMVRALQPAWFVYHGEKIQLHQATLVTCHHHTAPGTILDHKLTIACGEHTCLRCEKIQRPGRCVMDVKDFLNGWNILPHTVLS